MKIPFNTPFMTGLEQKYISEAHRNGCLAGDGPFTKNCHQWLKNYTHSSSLLTHSCTAALEMSAILLNIQPGDEVIMPSYTFVSTANAFVLRGGVPVFVDIRPDTLNIDETLIEAAITEKTKAIVPVHYAGVACDMDTIMAIAKKNDVAVVEDAAQGVMSSYNGKPLGSIGDLGTFSFHETKNVISGEGGALIINNQELYQRAEITREKGTDRSLFFRGQVDKYTWRDIGSSYLPGEIIAAFLWAQLQEAESITRKRKKIWSLYHKLLEPLEQADMLQRPKYGEGDEHNAHMYYILLKNIDERTKVITGLAEAGIHAVFHYTPLHSSQGGRQFGRTGSDMVVTNKITESILRLPLWIGLSESKQQVIVARIEQLLS